MVIVIHIWQKLSTVECEVTLIVTNIWRNCTDFFLSEAFHLSNLCSTWDLSRFSLPLLQRGETTRVMTKESPASSENLYIETGGT
jgi:hypothetical protein